MKLLIPLLALLVSCTSYTYRLQAPCKLSNQVLFERLTGVLVENGFQIKTVTGNYLQAETSPQTGSYGINKVNVWVITVNNDTIIAKAKVKSSSDDWNSETERSDSEPKSETWYWNVRDGLEGICGNKLLLIETEK